MMNTEIFGVPGSSIMATPTAPEGTPVAPMLTDLTQEEFGLNMANLINHILDCREQTEEELEGEGFILGGGSGSGGDPGAILLENGGYILLE